MIKYALACDRSHTFESWFQNSDAYDRQAARGLIACPLCGSIKVDKTLMAPSLARTRKRSAKERAPKRSEDKRGGGKRGEDKSPVAMAPPQEREFHKKLKELRDHLTKNADYVGPRFPEEARKMHYGEIEHRSIYGEASPNDARSLADEGIEFHPLPVLPDDRN